MPSAEGTHRARIPLVPVVFFLATAFIAGCAAAPAKVTVGGETRLSAPLHEPIAPYPTGEPELAFCVEVEEAGRAPGEALSFFRRHAPFRQIAAGDSDGGACDVRLNLHWEFATGGGTVVARSADDGAVLMSAEAEGVWGPTFGVERLGPIVYNAFVPGSPLYRKLTDARKAEEAAWQEAVRRYRETPVKPALPEEARRFKVQAEAALAQKEFAEAADRYRDALKAAPWWPEGRFNRALILGETGRYRGAIEEMKKYLALVPDAPDARAAQDKIYEWERFEAKKATVQVPAPPAGNVATPKAKR